MTQHEVRRVKARDKRDIERHVTETNTRKKMEVTASQQMADQAPLASSESGSKSLWHWLMAWFSR